MTAPRRRLTKLEFAIIWRDQCGLCACGCGQEIDEKTDEQHSPPYELMKDVPGYDGKPTELLRRECHKRITKERDSPTIVKARHQAGGKGSQQARRKAKGPQIKSRNTLGGKEYQARKAWKDAQRDTTKDNP